MTQRYRWLAPVVLLLAVAAGVVSAVEPGGPPRSSVPCCEEPSPSCPSRTAEWISLPRPASSCPASEVCPACPGGGNTMACPAAPQPSAPVKVYEVETQLFRIPDGGAPVVHNCVCLAMADGSSAVVALAGVEKELPFRDLLFRVTMKKCDKNEAHLVMSVEPEAKAAVALPCMRTERSVAFDAPAQLVVQAFPDGNPKVWIETTVHEIGVPAAGTAPAVRSEPLPWSPSDVAGWPMLMVDEMAGVAGDLMPAAVEGIWETLSAAFGETEVEEVTLPSPQYLQHPPQYFPATPALPMPCEAVTRGVVPVQLCSTATVAAPPTVQIEADHGRTRLQVSGGRSSVEASARRVRMESGHILLEGDVHLHLIQPGCSVAEVAADKVDVRLQDGDVKVQVGD